MLLTWGAELISQFASKTKVARNTNWLWSALDLLIVLVSLFAALFFLWLTFQNPNLVNLLGSVGSLIGSTLSIVVLYRNIIQDNFEREQFKGAAEILFHECEKIIDYHSVIIDKDLIQDRVIRYLLPEWKKAQSISLLEYQLIDSYATFFAESASLPFSDKLFVKYRIVTGHYNEYFSTISSELQSSDFATEGTQHNIFLKKLFLFYKGLDVAQFDSIPIDSNELHQFASIAFRKSVENIEELLSETKNRERIHFLLNKAYENAYAAVGQISGSSKKGETLYLLFKYDERFSILKRKWHTAILENLSQRYRLGRKLDVEFEKQKGELGKLISPLPFFRAIKDFQQCIYPVGKDNFLFVIDPRAFDLKARNWQPHTFMQRRVIPRARIHLSKMNEAVVRAFPYLKNLTKKELNANYYIFPVSRENIGLYAEHETIPPAIRNFLLNQILDSNKAGEHVASQLIYIKQVVDNLSISGLLFTETSEVQADLLKVEKKILGEAKRASLSIGNIHEIASIGNKQDVLAAIFHLALYGKRPRSKKTKNYKSCTRIVETLVINARDIIHLFQDLKA